MLRVSARALTALALAVAIACADQGPPTEIDESPLSGLSKSSVTDSAGNAPDSAGNPPDTSGGGGGPDSTTQPPPPPAPPAPAGITGTVMGQFTGAPGTDSIANAPRIQGVRVTVYPRAPTPQDSLKLGEPVAMVTTDSKGEFQVQTLPGGSYVVTFVPPSDSPYRGVWVSGVLDGNRYQYPWWIVLPKK